jgi:LuxR family transcriptional regulator, maltose regulon positive regulatory protein
VAPEQPQHRAAQSSLLATKLVVPRPRWPPVERTRLYDLLQTGTKGPLTLVAGPPGAGKTILLASWVAGGRPPGPVAWVTVDPDDQDPARFWGHVLAALGQTGACPPDGLLAHLEPSPGVDQRFLVSLVNGLDELPEPVVLVLDDLHEAGGPAMTAGLQFVLRHAPPQLRLVLATRVDPALSLHRLRVAGRLTELRAADLAFLRPEAEELLAGLGIGLEDSELERLLERTEGWAAGLRLAALSLGECGDPGRFVDDFAGDDRAVAGYLFEEVLARQPSQVQEFLLRTCVVERVCGELAGALVSSGDGERTLARLERDQVFTAAVGPARTWYRYHPLFAELLRAELRHRWPREVPELHRRASAWFGAKGLVAEAVGHALDAGDPDAAAALLAEHWLELVVGGRAAMLLGLLRRLPVDRLRASRQLAAIMAVSLLELGELDEAGAWLDPAVTAAPDAGAPDAGVADAWVADAWVAENLAHLLRARLLGDLDGARSTARRLLAPSGGPGRLAGNESLRALVVSVLGAAELWGGQLDTAAALLDEGRARATRSGRAYLVLGATGLRALQEAGNGRLGRAERLGRTAADVAGRHGWAARSPAAAGQLALAWVAYHRDDPVGAFEALERADQAAAGRDPQVGREASALRARLAAPPGSLPRHDGGQGAATLPAQIEACLRDAVTRRRQHDHKGAHRRLERALELAAPEGYRRVFVESGAPVRALLVDHLHADTTQRPFVTALLEGLLSQVPAPVGPRATGGGLEALAMPVESLSDREQVVLRYLSSMLSAGEIADELYVSINTVKTHIKSIYRKLDTNRRWDAVRRARQLRLL